MTTNESVTGRIRITKVPAGEAPFEVRRAWVGCVLPCHPHLGYPSGGLDRDVVSDKERTRNRIGFSVPQDRAIIILRRYQPWAERWWRRHGYPKLGECFCFGENEAEILSGVTHQKIIEVTDDMQGKPSR